MCAIPRPEVQADAQCVGRREAGVVEADHGLRDDERELALEPVAQPLSTVVDLVAVLSHVDPDGPVAGLDGEDAGVVCPLIERAPGLEIEPGVMPVTREDAVLHGSSVKRKAHVGTAVLDGKDLVVVREERNGDTAGVRHERAEPAYLVEARRLHEARGQCLACAHHFSSRSVSRGSSVGAAGPAVIRRMADIGSRPWSYVDGSASPCRTA